MEEQKENIVAQYLEKDAEILKENGLAPHGDPEQGGGSPKSKYWKFVGGFFALIFVGVIGIPMVGQYIEKQEDAKRAQDTENYMRFTLDLQERLKNDKNGGATPEETLQLFTDALKAGDIEQANKYFVIYPEERQEALIGRLEDVQNRGEFEVLISDLEKSKYMSNSSDEYVAVFDAFNKKGMSNLTVEITKDNYSTVWKIENFMF